MFIEPAFDVSGERGTVYAVLRDSLRDEVRADHAVIAQRGGVD
jgi:hypothetical protein